MTPIVLFHCVVEQYELLLLLLQVTQFIRPPIYSVSSAMCKTDCPSSLSLMTFRNHGTWHQRWKATLLSGSTHSLAEMIVGGGSSFDDVGVQLLLQACFSRTALSDQLKYSPHLFSWSPFGLALGVFIYLTCLRFTCFLAVDLPCCCSCLVTVKPSIHGLHRHYLAYAISQELT